jgi:hypothetical protein
MEGAMEQFIGTQVSGRYSAFFVGRNVGNRTVSRLRQERPVFASLDYSVGKGPVFLKAPCKVKLKLSVSTDAAAR